MLARKTVASRALRKALNKRLKASQVKESQAPNSDSSSESESYQSATEGGGHGSSDSKKIQESPSEVSSYVIENLETRFVLVGLIRDVELPGIRRSGGKKNFEKKEREGSCGEERGIGKGVVPAICGVEHERVEESGMKSGGSGSGEAVEGLVHLSTQRDEPVPSTEETLADLLKKVGASYDPKKRKTPTTKAPNVLKPSKKRKSSSPTPTASSLPRGRATRSKIKQSEADLQRALEESKKKRKDKGKGKIAETSEAVEEEEMELVHQERGTTLEVPTPKPKKPKTSSKKSSSVPVTDEPTLAKRTRSAVKTKQSNVSDDDDWRMMRLVDALAAQGWKDMVLQMDGRLARNELIEFMANVVVKDGVVSSLVKGVQVQFDAKELGEILDIPSEGFDDYTRKSKVRTLVQEYTTKDTEIARLKAHVVKVETERDGLKTELAKEKEKNDGILQNMLNLLQTQTQPSSSTKP
ncbi:uncharacterized protein [Nicotiana sylvestris]|uniref:uncharacterized protein n=1 Tax=Nicotiana sylvestris TaxID=4096 RepID=UPI00388CBA43